jgi:hypothetical protein
MLANRETFCTKPSVSKRRMSGLCVVRTVKPKDIPQYGADITDLTHCCEKLSNYILSQLLQLVRVGIHKGGKLGTFILFV